MSTPHTLGDAVSALAAIAPPSYAGSWDNVGLILESSPLSSPLERILLTIDLEGPVLSEALSLGAGLITAYHPPIFQGLKRITRADPRQRALLDAVRAGVSIYSPHTALDAVPGGVCDWLAGGLGPLSASAPVETPKGLPPEWVGRVGAGRLVELAEPAPLGLLIERVKAHLCLPHLRVAASEAHAAGAPLRRIAVCPGAGGSLFEAVRQADLFLTGEMRHHDVLSRVAQGASVILTDHTNCERGYLPLLARQLQAALPGVEIHVSARDQDPLLIL